MKLQNLFESDEPQDPPVIRAIRELIAKTDVPVSITTSKSRSGTAYKINRLKSRRDSDEIMSQEDRFPMFIKLLKKVITKHVKDGDMINVERSSRYFSDAQEAKKAGKNTDADLESAFQEMTWSSKEDPERFPRIFVLRQTEELMECTFELSFHTTHPDNKSPAKFIKPRGSDPKSSYIGASYAFKAPEAVVKRFVRLARGLGKSFTVYDPEHAKFMKLLNHLVEAGVKLKSGLDDVHSPSEFEDRRIVNARWHLTPYKILKRSTEITDPQIFILTSEFAEKQDKVVH